MDKQEKLEIFKQIFDLEISKLISQNSEEIIYNRELKRQADKLYCHILSKENAIIYISSYNIEGNINNGELTIAITIQARPMIYDNIFNKYKCYD